MHRGQGSPRGVIGGVGGIEMECVKADTAARCCLAGEGPRLQLHAGLRAFQGSSSGDLRVWYCWNCCREQSQQSYNPPADCLGGGTFSQQQSGHRSLEADCEPAVWEEGVCVLFLPCGLFVPDSGLAFYQSISTAFPLLLFRTESCISHDMVVKVEPANSSIGILPFSSGYSVCLGTTDSIMASGGQGLLRQEPLIQTACVCSYKHAADFTFITYSSANTDALREPCPDFHPS